MSGLLESLADQLKQIESKLDALLETTKSPEEPERLMTPQDAAQFLGRHPATLARWRSMGVGPTYTSTGGRICYRMTELEAWIESRKNRRPKQSTTGQVPEEEVTSE